MKELLEYRAEFPILETTTYMISNSLGAMPRSVSASLERYARAWATRGVRAWEEGWWEMAVALGDKVAPLIGADPGTISLHENVTLTQAVIASCFRFDRPRRRVVLSDKEFPSVVYFWHAQRRYGAEIELVRTAEDPLRVPTEKLLAAIDERTLLVPLSHVLFRSAYVQDVAAIVEKAHRAGARVILDAYQSAGVLPVEAKKWRVDFCVGGTLKWLCGGPGVAYLYVRPDLRAEFEPSVTGWLAHPRPFDFEVGPGAYRDDAFRFLNGTPHIPAFYAAEPGLDIIGQVGVEPIRRRSLELTRRLIEKARGCGWRVHTPDADAERGGTVTLDVPRGPEVLQELLRREVLVDYRPSAGIRVSPHFYNTEEECDRLLAAISEILAA
ncbi:MAG: aminotransferase class V-fold PLP-dependent enzyme [Acidobacteria bacterium]|nr:aminotransferase class V-fold PLP-dependent enzyme [Acidobacteriota bacterium]